MRKYSILILILVLFSCHKETKISTNGTRLRGPSLSSLIDDKKVTLKYYSPLSFDKFSQYKFVDPDYFDIYMSEGQLNNFTEVTELKNDNKYEYNLSNLNNNSTYYFYVIAKKEGYIPIYSDTIMVIPNSKLDFENLIEFDNNHTIVSVSYSSITNKISYVDNNYYWNGGENCCMANSIIISSIDNQNAELLVIDSSDPDWSPNGDKIVFLIGSIGHGYYTQIALYDLSSKTISKLTNDTTYYYNPTFSLSGDKILYQSNKNRPDLNSTNIWMMDLNTLNISKIIDLSTNSFINVTRPNWINESDFIFQGTKSNNITSIYKSSIVTKKVEPVIESQWNDYCAVISPNADQIAFISDRSSNEQLWLFNLQTKEYKQLTGYDSTDFFLDVWSKINWIDNSHYISYNYMK
jgi:hypothetical protein